MSNRTKQRRFSFRPAPAEEWPPPDLALPDSIQEIEAGRPPTARPMDHSKAARLRRLCSMKGKSCGHNGHSSKTAERIGEE